MNDSKIRIEAEIIRSTMQNIAAHTAVLALSYDKLYDDLRGADPQRDQKFERFMLTFTRAMHALQSDRVRDLDAAADDMRAFASSTAQSEVGHAVPPARPAPVVAARCAASVSAQR